MRLRRPIWPRLVALCAALAALCAAAWGFVAWQRVYMPLPYHDSFHQNRAQEWQAYGGVWQLTGGTVFNRSDERGAKLVTGSRRWTNYRMQADLEMLGHAGDIGVMVRVGQEEEGIDSYNGYYIGLRSTDSSLIIGRADHGWMEGRPVPMPGGVHASQWFRLVVVAVGCHIAVSATNLETSQTAWGNYEERPCVHRGKIGLRSMGTGGAWKNISVTPATRRDWQQIAAHTPFVEHPIYPSREADYNRMHEEELGRTYSPPRGYQAAYLLPPPPEPKAARRSPPVELVRIDSLRSITPPAPPVKIRGVVTLTDPVYVQDSTGGIAVDIPRPVALNLGDEIEVEGTLASSGYTTRLAASSIRLLWDRTPVVPLSISSTQAASGAFNSSLVEIRGYLYAKHKGHDGTIRLTMGDQSQTFTVILRNTLSMRDYNSWEVGSWLRVHGVCVIGEPYGSDRSAFALLTRSVSDVEVLAGPPWWSGTRILRVIIPALLLISLAVIIYIRIERWKMTEILSERERLAHDMHDTLAQSFAGVSFHLQGMRNAMRSGTQSEVSSLMKKLDLACDLVAQTHREASASIAALHPDADEGRDLLVALERYAMRMINTDDLPLEIERQGTPRELSFPVRDTLFQVGREALTNVIRHGQANHIQLRLTYEPKFVVLEVHDDGVGFLSESSRGFGIQAMQHRCEAIGANLSVKSSLGAGTTVKVHSPYRQRRNVVDWIKLVGNRWANLLRQGYKALVS